MSNISVNKDNIVMIIKNWVDLLVKVDKKYVKFDDIKNVFGSLYEEG